MPGSAPGKAPNKVVEISQAEFSVLYANPPAAEDTTPVGVLLRDPASDTLYLRLRQDWDLLIRDEDTWYFEKLEQVVTELARELGGKRALDVLLQGANAVQMDDMQTVAIGSYPGALNRLYTQHVPVKVRRFETHLPIYSLRSAAGRFLENSDIEPEGWIEMPRAHGLSHGQFIAHIVGTSMEPLIPDGSLAVFDAETKGTRVGRYVLVEERRGGGVNAYTLKKYESVKRAYSEDTVERIAIRLLPVNPEHDPIELEPEDDRYRIIGFFVKVLDPALAEAIVSV